MHSKDAEGLDKYDQHIKKIGIDSLIKFFGFEELLAWYSLNGRWWAGRLS